MLSLTGHCEICNSNQNWHLFMIFCKTYHSWLYITFGKHLLNLYNLTHISLASYFWDIGKQYRPRWDSAECGISSGSTLFAYRNFYKKWNKNEKILLIPSKIESGLVQMIMMGKSIRQMWVNLYNLNAVSTGQYSLFYFINKNLNIYHCFHNYHISICLFLFV